MTYTAASIVPVVLDRVSRSAPAVVGAKRRTAIWKAAYELWQDEFSAYQALRRRGMHEAAECAWQRRSAAADLASILVQIM